MAVCAAHLGAHATLARCLMLPTHPQRTARALLLVGAILPCIFACREHRAEKVNTVVESASKPVLAASSDTPASLQFAAWLNAFNTADRAALLAYHQQYFL
jgi:hypothetical protein